MASKRKNTRLARKLAALYEEHVGPFPGGVENACIERTYAGRNQRAQGSWVWCLGAVDRQYVHGFGSHQPAREVVASKRITVDFWSFTSDHHVYGDNV